MKFEKKCLSAILLILSVSLGNFVTGENNNYKLGFQTNAEMVYEYTNVDINLLVQLAIEDFSYEGLYSIPQGLKIKWVSRFISDGSNSWNINLDVYRGESFSELVGDFDTFVFKDPMHLSDALFNGTGNDLYVLPMNLIQYLHSFNQTIPFIDKKYSFISNNSITFDYTQIGLNNTIRYEYNNYGMMSHYQIFYNHSLAFSLELKSFSLGGLDPFFLTLIIISSISTILLTIFFLMRRRKYKRKTSRKKINKTLKRIK